MALAVTPSRVYTSPLQLYLPILMSNDLNQYYLQQMGIQVWIERPVNSTEIKLSQLERKVSSCTDCALHQNRSKSVFGRGNSAPRLMIIGDAPSIADDQEGKPFTGKTGALLNRMLSSIGLTEGDVYITNILKCRPYAAVNPSASEISRCGRYLTEQISLIAPDIILVLGGVAGQFFINTTDPMITLRGKPHFYGDIPCIISFHPDYLLAHPLDKKAAYDDWLEVKKILTNRL